MAVCQMCIVLELSTLAPSQYIWGMTGYAEYNGVGYAGDADGFYSLTGDDDNGTAIDATIKLPTTDFGEANQKRMRRLHIGFECNDELEMTVTADQKHSMNKNLKSAHSNSSHGRGISVNRNVKGRYFDLEISNTDGCDFAIDSIDALILKLSATRST